MLRSADGSEQYDESRRAVENMRDSGDPRGGPTDDACLRHMGVDDDRAQPSNEAHDVNQRPDVSDWTDAVVQLRDPMRRHTARGERGGQCGSRASRLSADRRVSDVHVPAALPERAADAYHAELGAPALEIRRGCEGFATFALLASMLSSGEGLAWRVRRASRHAAARAASGAEPRPVAPKRDSFAPSAPRPGCPDVQNATPFARTPAAS